MNHEEIMMIKELDVNKITYIFQKIQAKIILGQGRVNKLKGCIHWVKDFCRTSMVLYIDGLYQYTFRK